MSVFFVLAMCLPAAMGLFHLWRASQGFAALKRIISLRTTPLREIAEGPVEVEGTSRPSKHPWSRPRVARPCSSTSS